MYVTGLPPEITPAALVEFFAKCGIVRRDPLSDEPKIKIYRDEAGAAKGDGLVSYLKPESVPLAVDMLDEAFITPSHRVRVQKAEFKMKGDVFRPRERRGIGDEESSVGFEYFSVFDEINEKFYQFFEYFNGFLSFLMFFVVVSYISTFSYYFKLVC